jgi:hypothetical protein
MAFRRDDFSAPIEVTVEGLPPGVACAGGRIPAGKSSALVYLTADADAPDWSGPIHVVGQASEGEVTWRREACGGSVVWGVGDYNNDAVQSRLSAALNLAVGAAESAAVTVASAEAKVWSAPLDSKLEIPLAVARHGDFNEALKFKVVGLEALDKMKEFDVDGKATNTTLTIDLKEFKVPAGSYVVALRAVTKGKYRNQPEAAKEAETAKEAAAKEAAEAAEAAKKAAQDLETATTKAGEAAERVKIALEKFETAKLAGQSSASDEAVAGALLEAEKIAQAATVESRQLEEVKDNASRAKAEGEARAKEAESRKKETADKAKEAADRAKPREVTFTVYSAPIQFEVQAAAEKKD